MTECDDLGAKLTAFDLEPKALSYRCANDEKLTLRIEKMLHLAQGTMDSLRRILFKEAEVVDGFGTRQAMNNDNLHREINALPKYCLLTRVCKGSWIYAPWVTASASI